MRDYIFNNEWAYITFKILALLGCFSLMGFIAAMSFDYMNFKKFRRRLQRGGK